MNKLDETTDFYITRSAVIEDEKLDTLGVTGIVIKHGSQQYRITVKEAEGGGVFINVNTGAMVRGMSIEPHVANSVDIYDPVVSRADMPAHVKAMRKALIEIDHTVSCDAEETIAVYRRTICKVQRIAQEAVNGPMPDTKPETPRYQKCNNNE